MAINFDKALGPHPLALTLRAQRAELLASNLANADTPGYKARDLDFESLLRQATGSAQGVALNATDPRHMGAGASRAAVLYRVPDQASLDGNTVETDMEQARFAENALAYQASLRFLNGRLADLRTAIKGE